jgi:hypothetical protein
MKTKTETAATKKATPPLPSCEIPKPATPTQNKNNPPTDKKKNKKAVPATTFWSIIQ